MNSQIETGGGGEGNIGIGFAVPVDTVKEVVPRLRKDGSIERAYLGVTTLTIDDSLDALHLPSNSGALVQARRLRRPGRRRRPARGLSAASRSMVARSRSTATSSSAINGKRVRTSAGVAKIIGAKRPGDSVRIGILRDGKRKTVTVKLAKRPG